MNRHSRYFDQGYFYATQVNKKQPIEKQQKPKVTTLKKGGGISLLLFEKRNFSPTSQLVRKQ